MALSQVNVHATLKLIDNINRQNYFTSGEILSLQEKLFFLIIITMQDKIPYHIDALIVI